VGSTSVGIWSGSLCVVYDGSVQVRFGTRRSNNCDRVRSTRVLTSCWRAEEDTWKRIVASHKYMRSCDRSRQISFFEISIRKSGRSQICVCFFFNSNLESFTIYGHVLIFCAISVTFFGHCRAGQTAQTSSSDFGHFDGTNTKRKEIHMVFNCHRFSFRQ
jgi:hypothetical protein